MAGGAIIPLFILFAFVGVAAYIGYHISVWSSELADRGKKKLEKQNMSFTADGGLKVKVKQMSDESYADKTQNILVNTWNNASFPAYKSRLGWNSSQGKLSPSVSPRPGASRENSDSARLKAPEQKSSVRRAASPVPGGWD
ncbi:hypothetical protein AMS68_001497 [Peltaster fructicola]|uniref:Uncharacterized protein n=1 Tax=Peltaster fructicola TaxID=286661 RepID=A0A6H0XNB5_9PEZI|nr:hypothetical protein AMS68_001497 [Peltaster fructicola]